MKTKEVKVELLKDVPQADFRSYGQIMGIEKGVPLEDFPYLRYWPKNVDLGLSNEDIDAGLLLCMRTDDEITKMERHKLTLEVLFPLTGETIWVMAPADNSRKEPDPTRIRAFLLDGTLGICLNKGTWHWAPVCLRETAKFIVLLKGRITDIDYQDLGVELRLVM